MRLLFCAFCQLSMLFMPAMLHASLLQHQCADELDKAVGLFSTGESLAAKSALEKMLDHCHHLPQVHHNLGVVAGLDQKWKIAESHFRRAIQHDSRTSMTVAHLQSMHQYRATEAYQSALRVKRKINTPILQMQDSTTVNSSFNTPPKTDQHNVATVDYELYAWWSAAAENEISAWLEHYTKGYPPLENIDAQAVGWNDVARDISFTAQDAVVVLRYQIDAIDKRMLLLLRLQNNRWKIYKEATL